MKAKNMKAPRVPGEVTEAIRHEATTLAYLALPGTRSSSSLCKKWEMIDRDRC